MGFWDRLRGRPTRDDFAQMVIKAMRQRGEARPIHYDPAGFKLRIGDEPAAVAWLANGHDDYLRAPRAKRADILRRYALGPLPAASDRLEDILPRLLPRVRDRFFYTAMDLRLELEGMPARSGVFRPIAEHLALGLVQDLPDHIIEIPADGFEKWGMTFEEALAIARRNLEPLSAAPFDRVRPGVYVSPWRDNHDTARLLLTDALRRLLVRGDPVVMVAHRDTLIVTGTDDVQGLTAMAMMTESLLEEPRAISGIPVCLLDDDTWAPFVPEPDHPLFARFAALRVGTLATEYGRQKQLLEALHDKRGEDLFVATYEGRMSENEREVLSYCAWTRDVVTLLPHTDRILFVDLGGPQDRRAVPAAWHRAAEVVGDLLHPVDIYPPRYRVAGFPNPEQLDALRKDGG